MTRLEQAPIYIKSCTSPHSLILCLHCMRIELRNGQHGSRQSTTHQQTSDPNNPSVDADLILSGRSRQRTGCIRRWPSLLHDLAAQITEHHGECPGAPDAMWSSGGRLSHLGLGSYLILSRKSQPGTGCM